MQNLSKRRICVRFDTKFGLAFNSHPFDFEVYYPCFFQTLCHGAPLGIDSSEFGFPFICASCSVLCGLSCTLLVNQEDMRTDMIKPNGPALRSALFQWASGVYTTRGIEGFYRPRRFAQQNAGSKRPSRRSFFWQGFGIGSMPSPSPSPSLSSSSTPFSSSQQHATTTSFEDISEAERAAQKQLWPPLVGMFLFGLFKHPLTPMRGLVCDTQHLASSLRHNCGGDLTFQGPHTHASTVLWCLRARMTRTFSSILVPIPKLLL